VDDLEVPDLLVRLRLKGDEALGEQVGAGAVSAVVGAAVLSGR
jgi:hypothetical protein